MACAGARTIQYFNFNLRAVIQEGFIGVDFNDAG